MRFRGAGIIFTKRLGSQNDVHGKRQTDKKGQILVKVCMQMVRGNEPKPEQKDHGKEREKKRD